MLEFREETSHTKIQDLDLLVEELRKFYKEASRISRVDALDSDGIRKTVFKLKYFSD